MNQAQYINNLNQHAAASSAYLRQTNRGAISVAMRHSAIYAMTGLAQALGNEQLLNQNLQNQVDRANIELARLAADNAEKGRIIDRLLQEKVTDKILIHEVITQAAKDAEDLKKRNDLASEEFKLIQDKTEKDRRDLVDSYSVAMVQSHQTYKKELADAEAEVAKAKEAKRNSNRVLNYVLEFVEKQEFALAGYLLCTYNIVEFDFQQVSDLANALRLDSDLEFDEVVMEMIATFDTFGVQVGAVDPSSNNPAI